MAFTLIDSLKDQNEQNVASALYLIKIITRILVQNTHVGKEHLDLLYNTIRKFIKCDTRLPDGQTLLHMAVNGVTPVDDFYTSDVCKYVFMKLFKKKKLKLILENFFLYKVSLLSNSLIIGSRWSFCKCN